MVENDGERCCFASNSFEGLVFVFMNVWMVNGCVPRLQNHAEDEYLPYDIRCRGD